MRSLLVACVLVTGLGALASADPEPSAQPKVTKLTLEQAIAKALAGPRIEMAEGDREAAEGRSSEADAARYPRIKANGFGTISPKIVCENPDCTETSPHNFALRFSGFYGSAELEVTQPIYTFGKISHARAAAREGVAAQRALADEAAGDLASDTARAYWGIKVSREIGFMLDDGIEEIEKAKGTFDTATNITLQDRQRVAVLLAEAKAQRAEVAMNEAQALAGLRAVTGIPDADVDDAELAPVTTKVPDANGVATASDRRPQKIAAMKGALAADELAKFEAAQILPNFALVGKAVVAGAQGADDPPSAFAYDPYNRFGAGAVLGFEWTLDWWTIKSRTKRARAEARKMHAQANLAAIGARFDAETARSEATAALQKIDAANEGEKAARAWLAAVLQNQAIGTAEPKDFADAYIAWFQMKARWALAVMQFNVAVVRLGRATGEFHAGQARPR